MNITTPVSGKTCKYCGLDLPFDAFDKRAGSSDGHRNKCKDCRRAYVSNYISAHPKAREWRDLATRNLRSKPDYAEKERERHRRAYAADPAKRREAVRKSYQKHAEKRREERRQRRQANLDQERARDREYQKAHPERRREMTQRRRARKKALLVGTVNLASILQRDGYICHLCLGTVDVDDVQYDHMIPLSKGGAHAEFNIAVAHSQCNLKKNNREITSARYPHGHVI